MNEYNNFQNNDNTKVFSILSYIWILFVVGLIADPTNPKVRFHANQGLVLLITQTILGILNRMVKGFDHFFFFNFTWYTVLLSIASGLFILGLMIIGIVNASNGVEKPLPIIGSIRLIK